MTLLQEASMRTTNYSTISWAMFDIVARRAHTERMLAYDGTRRTMCLTHIPEAEDLPFLMKPQRRGDNGP